MFGFDFEEDLKLAEGEFLRKKHRKISQDEEGFRSKSPSNEDHDFFYPESQKSKPEKNMFLSAESPGMRKESIQKIRNVAKGRLGRLQQMVEQTRHSEIKK